MTKFHELGIDRMTAGERIALMQDILDSLAAERPRPPLSEAKKAELARRLANLDENPEDCFTREEVEAAARTRFAR